MENLAQVVEGARAAVLEAGVITADAFAAAVSELRTWGRRPDAALWYATCWAEGRRPD